MKLKDWFFFSATEEEKNAYAETLSRRIQVWSAAGFYAALGKGRSQEEKKMIVNEIYSKYKARIAQDPAQHGADIICHVLCLEKVWSNPDNTH